MPASRPQPPSHPRWLHSRPALFVLLLSSIAGCVDDGSSGTDGGLGVDEVRLTASAARDSAGVEIVETAFPDDPTRLYTLESPVLSLGPSDEGDDAGLDRVQDALRLEDGRFVVLNSGSHEVRIYAADGRLAARFGRQGNGPADFAGFPGQLALSSGDTLSVWDLATWETKRYLLDGSFVDRSPGREAFQPRIPEGLTAEGGRLSPGRGLVLNVYDFGLERRTGETFRPTVRLMYLPLDGGVREMGAFDGIEQFVLDDGGRRQSVPVPFGSAGVVAFGGRPFTVWAGQNDRFELRQFGPDGRLRRIVRADRPALPVRPEYVDRYLEEMERAMSDAGLPADRVRSQIALARRIPVSDSIPVFGPIFVTRNGGAWVGRIDDPATVNVDEPGPAVFDVFGPHGEWRGTAAIPRNLRPLEIGLDYLLGLRTDERGVQHVDLHALEAAGD